MKTEQTFELDDIIELSDEGMEQEQGGAIFITTTAVVAGASMLWFALTR